MDKGPIQVGFPQFLPECIAAFPKFFEVLPRLQQSANEIYSMVPLTLEPPQKLALVLSLAVGYSMTEVITLVGNGCGSGAMKLVRSMLENAVNGEYLRRHPEQFEDYRDWFFVEQKRLLDDVRVKSPGILKSVGDEKVQHIEREFVRVKPRYVIGKDERLQSSWCKESFLVRAKAVGLEATYFGIYVPGCELLHGSVGGLAALFDTTDDTEVLDKPPSLKLCEQALSAAHLCIVQALGTLVNTLEIDPNPYSELERDCGYAWGYPAESHSAAVSGE